MEVHAYTKKERRGFFVFYGVWWESRFFVRIKTINRKVLSFKNQDYGKNVGK
jgi:hypothetical protein